MAAPARGGGRSDPDGALPVAAVADGVPAAAVVAFRVVLAGLAWWGLIDALGGDPGQLRYFSQVSCLTVALAATAGVVGAGVRSDGWLRALDWCRGAATTYAVVTAVLYQVLLSGNLDSTSSLLEHAVVPALALLEWLTVGPARGRQPFWTALSWLVLPLGYLAVYYTARKPSGEPLYPFLDPDAAGFWRWVAIMITVFVVAGALIWALGRLRERRGARR